jgi:ABC-type nitrate/sulfonate/bicarbonate transport system ATPase subunit
LSEVSIEMEEIVQRYPSADGSGTVEVIGGVSLAMTRPSINMLLGPSGCGKSTLLRMMGGVRPFGVATPTTGRITIDGKACTGAHDDAVMVFQRYANRPDLTVRDNVAFPFTLKLWRKKFSAAEAKQRVDEMLAAVGLADKAELRPSQLSGGQNQRVALARALVLRPRILLMDEPFGALDAQTREEMQRLLVTLFNSHPCLIVFVTHDVTEALLLADRVVVLTSQPARIADDFTITEPRPRSSLWQRSTEAVKMEERILEKLHGSGSKGQVRVSV